MLNSLGSMLKIFAYHCILLLFTFCTTSSLSWNLVYIDLCCRTHFQIKCQLSRCFWVLEHRGLHIETETFQPGDICGLTRVGGWRYEVPLWCGWYYPVARWVGTDRPFLWSCCSYRSELFLKSSCKELSIIPNYKTHFSFDTTYGGKFCV